MSEWIPYQPDRARDKEFYDIKLRDGTVVTCCWPNADAWTPMFGPKAGDRFKDYRVTHIRRCVHPMDRPEKGDRVKVCDNPQCGHSGGITGKVDIIGFFTDTNDPTEELATVLRDGGGMCGPFRLHELTLLDA